MVAQYSLEDFGINPNKAALKEMYEETKPHLAQWDAYCIRKVLHEHTSTYSLEQMKHIITLLRFARERHDPGSHWWSYWKEKHEEALQVYKEKQMD